MRNWGKFLTELVCLTSPLLASLPHITHAFTTRHGGISQSPYDSLNLRLGLGDADTAVLHNRQRVLAHLQGGHLQWVGLQQVHGASVLEVNTQNFAAIATDTPADAWWTHDKSLAMAVLVADCVPLLLADVHGRAIMAVHAGWRGTQAQIAACAVKALQNFNIDVADLRVSIGPSIGPCCFDVGDDVCAALRQSLPYVDAWYCGENPHRRADLWQLNVATLRNAGIKAQHIDVLGVCTHCHADFFSYRREGEQTGRQAAVIAFFS